MMPRNLTIIDLDMAIFATANDQLILNFPTPSIQWSLNGNHHRAFLLT